MTNPVGLVVVRLRSSPPDRYEPAAQCPGMGASGPRHIILAAGAALRQPKLQQEFVAAIGALDGNDFQRAICAHLEISVDGFQAIPADGGDGGLDGVSTNCTKGYLCYGAEVRSHKTNRERVDDIVTKFRNDLRRVCEVQPHGRSALRACTNTGLEQLMPAGTKLKHLYLICNWFHDKRIVGQLGTALKHCIDASKLRFVDPTVELVIMGPLEFASRYVVTEAAIARVERVKILARVESVAESLTIPTDKGVDFDQKIESLKAMMPGRTQVIDGVADSLRRTWLMSLALEMTLTDTLPRVHRRLERARRAIADQVNLRMLGADKPWLLIEPMLPAAHETIAKALGDSYIDVAEDAGKGEIARLLGECTIGWEAPPNHGQ